MEIWPLEHMQVTSPCGKKNEENGLLFYAVVSFIVLPIWLAMVISLAFRPTLKFTVRNQHSKSRSELYGDKRNQVSVGYIGFKCFVCICIGEQS